MFVDQGWTHRQARNAKVDLCVAVPGEAELGTGIAIRVMVAVAAALR